MTPWEQQIEDDLDWRTEELASLKHQIVVQATGSIAERALLRAIWAMLYAHYEGFCKFAFNLYVDQVEQLAPKRRELQKSILLLTLDESVRKLRGNLSTANCYEYFDATMHTLLNDAAAFPKDPKTNEFAMKGNSNLYPQKLRDNCDDLCLASPLVTTHHGRLHVLVTRRNDIAHGRQEIVKDIREYQEFEGPVVDVMHEIGLAVIEALDNCHYLRHRPHYYII